MITLQINGEQRTYSEEELTSILEEYYSVKAERPAEGIWYQINPRAINRGIFENKRIDENQERVRRLILEAFAEVDKNSKYSEPFEIMIPIRTKDFHFEQEIKNFANQIGDSQTNWIEQALEWAQRISNGETWESLCNKPDYNKWFRLIIGKNDQSWLIGGCCEYQVSRPTTYISGSANYFESRLWTTVPSVVRRKK